MIKFYSLATAEYVDRPKNPYFTAFLGYDMQILRRVYDKK